MQVSFVDFDPELMASRLGLAVIVMADYPSSFFFPFIRSCIFRVSQTTWGPRSLFLMISVIPKRDRSS